MMKKLIVVIILLSGFLYFCRYAFQVVDNSEAKAKQVYIEELEKQLNEQKNNRENVKRILGNPVKNFLIPCAEVLVIEFIIKPNEKAKEVEAK